MSRIPAIVRTLLGLGFVVFGLNYFFPFLPQPKNIPPDAIAFVMPFIGAKFMGLIKVIEIISGVLLVANLFVPLALTLLAPILVGITWFHIQLEPAALPLPIALLVLEIASAWFYRAAFAPMLRAKVEPNAPVNTAAATRATVSA
ncbi:MAG TPA: hypothetical protein VGC41_05750 [Kofleriaceae bacterium]